MALIPRWQYMTGESKVLAKRLAVTGAVVVFGLMVVRSLLPWLLVALAAWWLWKLINK